MSQDLPRAGQGDAYSAIVTAPGFALGLSCSDDEVTAIDFLPHQTERNSTNPLAMEAKRQLKAYLADPTFVFALPLRPVGTPFQRRVWEQIAAIPLGQTQTYGTLAKNLRNAPRAVGQACGANHYPLVIPCHRVVAASQGLNDGLGGFSRQGGGFLLDIKRWLLRHEGALPG